MFFVSLFFVSFFPATSVLAFFSLSLFPFCVILFWLLEMENLLTYLYLSLWVCCECVFLLHACCTHHEWMSLDPNPSWGYRYGDDGDDDVVKITCQYLYQHAHARTHAFTQRLPSKISMCIVRLMCVKVPFRYHKRIELPFDIHCLSSVNIILFHW